MHSYNQGYGSHNLCLEVEFDLLSDSCRHQQREHLTGLCRLSGRLLEIWKLSREQ